MELLSASRFPQRYNSVNLLQRSSHNYLINTVQLFKQSVHHHVHTEGLICVLPYGVIDCRMHLHAHSCLFMYMSESESTQLFSILFLFKVCESTLGCLTSWTCLFHSLSLFLCKCLSISPTLTTLVTLIHYIIGKCALNSPIWSIMAVFIFLF